MKKPKQPRLNITVDWNGFARSRDAFYNYVDYLPTGEPIYAGKGSDVRVRNRNGRNLKHTNVSQKHGQITRVVMMSTNEADIHANEVTLVAEHKTFYEDSQHGCNFTRGGDGTSGHRVSDEEKQKRSKRMTGEGNTAKLPLVRQHISEALTGRPHTEERKQHISEAKAGVALEVEHKLHIGEGVRNSKAHKQAQRKRYAASVQIHTRAYELVLTSVLKAREIAVMVSRELNINIAENYVRGVKFTHQHNKCRICYLDENAQDLLDDVESAES